MYLDALFPGKTVEDVKADVPWDLKVADTIHSLPVPCDEEIDFLRRFSPISSFPNQVGLQMMVENFMSKMAANNIQ